MGAAALRPHESVELTVAVNNLYTLPIPTEPLNATPHGTPTAYNLQLVVVRGNKRMKNQNPFCLLVDALEITLQAALVASLLYVFIGRAQAGNHLVTQPDGPTERALAITAADAAPIEATTEYKACFTKAWAILEPQGASIHAAYEFCTDDDEGARGALGSLNKTWRVDIRSL